LKKNNIKDSEEKQNIQAFLYKKLGKSYNEKSVLKEINEFLSFHKVEKESDI